MGFSDDSGARKVVIKCVCGNEIEKKVKRSESYSIRCARCGKLHKGK